MNKQHEIGYSKWLNKIVEMMISYQKQIIEDVYTNSGVD